MTRSFNFSAFDTRVIIKQKVMERSLSLAYITGRKIETVNYCREAGAVGAALAVAAGIKGTDVLELSQRLIKVDRVYVPDTENKKVYERNYNVFKNLHRANARFFRGLNG